VWALLEREGAIPSRWLHLYQRQQHPVAGCGRHQRHPQTDRSRTGCRNEEIMTRLLVTGASGMLGANLALVAQKMGYEVLGWTNSRPLVGAPFATRAVDFCDKEA